jgi:hypothetical protein
MPDYVLNKKYTHRSVYGHTISFEKGQPTHVPPGPIEREVAAIGAERVDGDPPDLVPGEADPKDPVTAEDLEALMREAFRELVQKNDSADFTASGQPSVKAVERLIGENVTAKQIADLWQKIKEEGDE